MAPATTTANEGKEIGQPHKVGATIVDALVLIKGVIHQDLCPHNILISSEENILLADFGDSSLNGEGPRKAAGEIGFFPCHQRDNANIPVDLFAFGSVLYEMETRQKPHAGLMEEQVIENLKKKLFPPGGSHPDGLCYHELLDRPL